MHSDIIKEVSKITDKETLLSILIVVSENLGIDTVSQVARDDGKTPKGIRDSKRYRKVFIGKQEFAVKELNDDGFPF